MAAQINLTVKADFAKASADLKNLGSVSEAQAKKIKEFTESFKTERIDNFVERQNRAKAAITATRGPAAALKSEQIAYRKEIEKLIKNGLDPMDDKLKILRDRYDAINDEMAEANTKTKKSSTLLPLQAAAFIYVAQQALQAAKAVGDFVMVMVDAASEAEEVQNKFDVTFSSIGDGATEAADDLADAFGLSETAAKSLLANTGDLLTGFGFTQEAALDLSENVQTLAGDLASFQNLETADVSDRITKALTGETESLKALGVVIRQDTAEYKDLVAGIMEAEGVSITQAKSLANLQIITEQSKNAVGDFARSQDSFANKSRVAKAALDDLKVVMGEAFLPAATAAVGIFGDLTTKATGFVTRTLQAWDAQRKLNRALKGGGEDLESSKEAYADVSAELDNLKKQLENAERPLTRQEASIPQVVTARKALAETLADEVAERESLLNSISQTIQRLEMEQEIESAAIVITEAQTEAINDNTDAVDENKEATEALAETTQHFIGDALVPMTEAEKELWKSYGEGVAAAKDDTEELRTEWQKWMDEITATDIVEAFTDISSSVDSIITSLSEKKVALIESELETQLAAIDEAMNAEIAAAGVTEATAIEALQSELAEAIADGDAETAAELEDEIERTKIQEEYADKAADAEIAAAQKVAKEEYKAALSSWNINLAQATAAAALAVAKALPNPITAGIAGIAGAAQVAAVVAAKPTAPSFQTGTLPSGFTVPESSSTRGDSSTIAVQPGENVQVTPRGEGSGQAIQVNVIMNDEVLESQVQSLIDANRLTFTSANLRSA